MIKFQMKFQNGFDFSLMKISSEAMNRGASKVVPHIEAMNRGAMNRGT